MAVSAFPSDFVGGDRGSMVFVQRSFATRDVEALDDGIGADVSGRLPGSRRCLSCGAYLVEQAEHALRGQVKS
jgi:hypothetical protein